MKRFLTSVSLQHEPKASDVITLVKKTFFRTSIVRNFTHSEWYKRTLLGRLWLFGKGKNRLLFGRLWNAVITSRHKMEMKYSDKGTLVQRQWYPLPSRFLQYWPMNHCVRNTTSRRSVFEKLRNSEILFSRIRWWKWRINKFKRAENFGKHKSTDDGENAKSWLLMQKNRRTMPILISNNPKLKRKNPKLNGNPKNIIISITALSTLRGRNRFRGWFFQ